MSDLAMYAHYARYEETWLSMPKDQVWPVMIKDNQL
jgi:hypothetical protein